VLHFSILYLLKYATAAEFDPSQYLKEFEEIEKKK
jgi:hypothetical protein